jgi:hypothetical protein
MASYPIFRGREKQLHRSLIFLLECNASSHVLLLPLYVKLSGGGQSPLVISPIYLSLLSMSISDCKNMKPLDAGTEERGSLTQFDVISSTSNHLHTDISVCMMVKGNWNS